MNKLQDINGKESSKRIMGFRLLNIGIGMALLFFVIGLGMALFSKEFIYIFPTEVWWTFMGTGAGLLGFTLFEKTKVQNEK